MAVVTPGFLTTSPRLTDFDFEVPCDRIAAYPAEPRDAARLMVVDRATGRVEHRLVRDLPEYFGPGDVVVVNDSAVFPARLRGTKEKTLAGVEVFLLRELNAEHRLWDAIVDPARKVRVGNKLCFGGGLAAEVIDNTTSRGRTLRFIFEGTCEEFHARIDEVGETPLPRYLRRSVEPADRARYQTMFARHRGSVALPCAGLHFTPSLRDALAERGAHIAEVTLHVGLGSFEPVEVEDLSKHRMDSERFAVSPAAAERINGALTGAGTVVTACGPTVIRAIESSLSAVRTVKAGGGWTDKFFSPPAEFYVTERLLTNFHRPRTTQLMAVASFAGMELFRHAYEEAVAHEYRLFSFGDAMLIL